jgi:hypothetical protein
VDTSSAKVWSATGSRGWSVTVTCISVPAAIDPAIRAPEGKAGAAPRRVTPTEPDPAATAPEEDGGASAVTATHANASAVNLMGGRIGGFSG